MEEDLEEVDLENEGEDRLRSRKDDLRFAKDQGIVSPRASLLEKIRSKLVSYGRLFTVSPCITFTKSCM